MNQLAVMEKANIDLKSDVCTVITKNGKTSDKWNNMDRKCRKFHKNISENTDLPY